MTSLGLGRSGASDWRPWPLVVFLILAFVGSARAQVPNDTIPAEPAPPDTILVPIPPEQLPPVVVPMDTVLEEPRDTIPALSFPRYREPLPTGWAFARWEWSRQDLELYRGLTILEFLERAPGLTVIRAGDHGYPVGITALGLGGGRVRVFIDGIEWDPLGFVSPDLQQIGTGNLESIRIARDPTGIRVDITILPLPDDDAMFSAVEAATGVYGSRILRGFLVRGFGRRVVFTGAYDAITTDGFGFQSPFSLVSTHLAVSYAFSQRTGVQAELRHSGVQRLGAPWRENADLRMLFLRGRTEIMPGLLLDGAVGRTWRLPADGDPLTAELTATQAFLRAGYVTDAASLEAMVRGRDGGTVGVSGRPGFEAAMRGSLRFTPLLTTEGEARMAGLGGGSPLLRGTVRLGPSQGPSLFGSLTVGEYPAPLVTDVTVEPPADELGTIGPEITEPRYSVLASSASSVRLGASWASNGLHLNLAGVALPATTVAPFGAAFDRELGPLGAGSGQGLETHLSIPIPRTAGALRLEGWGEHWLDRGGRYYLPVRQARAAAILNRTFFGEQLEPLVRFQVIHRGPMDVPSVDPDVPATTSTQYTLANLLIQIRILDVQVFGLWENAFDYRMAADIPGMPLPGLRLIYGFRWVFRD